MKRLVTKIVLLLLLLTAAGVLLLTRSVRFMTERFQVVDINWKLPKNEDAVLSDKLAWDGIEVALLSASQKPNEWKPVPFSEELQTILKRNASNSNRATAILTNVEFQRQLLADVELDVSNRILNVKLLRPK